MNGFKSYRMYLIPVLAAFFLSSFYIVVAPGPIQSDALEYDKLSNSILEGHFSIDDAPSMLREPGYPAFRALLKFSGLPTSGILWLQACLYALSVLFVGIAFSKIDKEVHKLATWGAALSYGLAFYPSTHLSETFVAFLLSIIGLLASLAFQNPKTKYWVWIGITSGLLLLTRYNYILIPIFTVGALYLHSIKIGLDKRGIVKKAAVSIFIILVMLIPWVIRNYKTFGEINVSLRSGTHIYARAWKAEKSWRSLGDSYVSVLLGRGLLFSVYPGNESIFQEQWGDWWRDPEKVKLWGTDPVEMDRNRKEAGLKIIFKDFNTFSKFTLWTGVDKIRLLALPNPVIEARGSPIEGTYGPLAKENGLSFVQVSALILAHLVQMLWFLAIIGSLFLGFKKYSYKFLPGIFLLAFILPHTISDNTARFGTPLEPWLLAGIFATIIPLLIAYIQKLFLKYRR